MDARFMQIHNLILTREVIINSMFPVDRMRELNFHRETAVILTHPGWWENSIKGFKSRVDGK